MDELEASLAKVKAFYPTLINHEYKCCLSHLRESDCIGEPRVGYSICDCYWNGDPRKREEGYSWSDCFTEVAIEYYYADDIARHHCRRHMYFDEKVILFRSGIMSQEELNSSEE